MKITIFQRVISIFGLSFLTVLFLACSDVPQFQEQQKAKVIISVADSAARTALPQASLTDVVSYKLLGGKTGAAETVLVDSFTGTGTSVALDPGIWNFTLNAYNDSDENILQGKVQNKQINLTGVNQVSFSLSVINSGTGSIQITLNFPEAAGITRISTNGDVDSENFTLDSGSTFVYTKNEIAAGDYLINFELYRGDVLRTVISELVLVRNGLASSKTITLVGEDLKPIYLTGTVTISPAVSAVINTELTASYSGTETVTYQWNKDGSAIAGATDVKYTPNSTGSYTVTVSSAGNNSRLISAAVAVINNITVPGATLAEKLDWLQANAQSYTEYILTVTTDEQLAPRTLSYSEKTNVTIDLSGVSAMRNILLSANGSLFTIGSGVTLILNNNITLWGRSGNSDSLVAVQLGGALVMNNGSVITGNTHSSSSSNNYYGGGVYVAASGTFTMNGGKISANNASYTGTSSSYSSYGGGVYNNGTFTMSGGEISNNTATNGGGVYGVLTMSGGKISGNTATNGGGVYGALTMSDGEISGNTALNGGGVYNNGTSTMSGGKILSNTASSSSTTSYGGGVYNNGTFTMSGGKILSNTASSSSTTSYGGGVYNNGTFTISNGEISSNTVSTTASYSSHSSYGGGISVGTNGTFFMTGGKISDNTASSSNSSSSNTTSSCGGGVSVNGTNGTFFMSGGEISGNTTFSSSTSSSSYSYGGGVYVEGTNGTFAMSDGEISSNTASSSSTSSSSYSYGGGVYVNNGTFTMNDGKIISNTASSSSTASYSSHSYSYSYGGGVYVEGTNRTFTMSGGEISSNTASSNYSSSGGGVYVNNGNFTMNDGEISSNTASSGNTVSSNGGGGVYVIGGTFSMSGGEISGNTVSSNGGGGVYVIGGTFTKTGGGTIYGYTDGNAKSNVVKNSSGVVLNNQGHAVYVFSNTAKRRESTAGSTVNMDSTVAGTAGGWED